MKYRIATRGSKLALAQANNVCDRLSKAYPDDEFEILVVRTKGDRILDKPLHQIGDRGVFVKEIEEKILKKEADIGVHSMKDMPSSPAAGLIFAKAWEREDFRDVLILREKGSLWELPEGAVIGTGSKRREFQLKRLRPDLKVVGIRGNVDTRLRKMEEEKLDGILLAAAGLHRLGMQNRITQYLEAEEMIPAPAQGVLALEIREGDERLLEMLNRFCDPKVEQMVEAERGFLKEMGGDCHVPLGAVCQEGEDGLYHLFAMFGDETGSRKAYVSTSASEVDLLVQETAAQIRRQMAGIVSLVGAGPGDPSLITVKGLRAIQEADCIVYDRLASPDLLKDAKPGCELVYVGKASHHHTMKQEEINRLLVQKSMKYKKTVRLKGGDVYVFGRGGEEGLFLKAKGVPFEVIPGVTSGIGGLAYAGIPVTHRGISQGFHIVTAHNQSDELADIDFKAMANGKETCIFLMGLSKVEEIANKLMEAGMSADTKAAVISNATTFEQKTCISDLQHIAEAVRQEAVSSPAVIVVGEVISLRDGLNFFESRPLFGKRYLIPKIGEKNTELKRLLQEQGAMADEVLVGEIVDREFPAEDLKEVDWLIFTSKNGVEAFFRNFVKSGLDVRSLAGCKIAAIGEKTAETLRKYSLYADIIPERYDSDSLIETLKKQWSGNEKVWYLKAENADSYLQKALDEICRIEEIVVYENQMVEPDLGKLRSLSDYDGILFTCASSVERMSGVLEQKWEQCGKIYSIGPKTTSCLKRYGVTEVVEAKQATYQGIVDAL